MASQNTEEMAPKDVLCEAIISIKKGHNKPNTTRICSYLQRKYDIAANRSIKAIHHFSSTGEIIAANPGASEEDLSYRVADAPTFDSFKGTIINKFMAELIINEPNYLTDGVPPARLVSFVAQKQPQLSRTEILDSIQAELSLGNLDTFDNGNYGYFPLDSSDEDEPEEKKKKTSSTSSLVKSKPAPNAKASPNANQKPSLVQQKPGVSITKVVPKSVPVRANGTKLIIAGKGNAEKTVGVEVKSNERRKSSASRFDAKEERKENMKKTEEVQEDKSRDEGRRKRMRKRRVYLEDKDFQPGSKDFKVDLSLERQARKRKEKKIFDPSALESKTRKKGGSVQIQNTNASSNSLVISKKWISPGKKILAGSSVKVGSVPQVPPGGRTTISPMVPTSVCYLCQTYGKRVKGVPEKLISCVKCSTNKTHISCLNDARGPEEKPFPLSAPVNDWTCAKCQWSTTKCVYCNEFKADIYILECIECKSGFHVPCHKGLIPAQNKQDPIIPNQFKCVRCEPRQQKVELAVQSPVSVEPSTTEKPKQPDTPRPRPIIVSKITLPVSQPKVVVSKLKPNVNLPEVNSIAVEAEDGKKTTSDSQSKSEFNNNENDPFAQFPVNPEIPDCQSWSSGDVFNYLSERLMPEVCQQVLDADIDGKALLLLKRADCFDLLNLPIGYGLKLWVQVHFLQTKKSDIELFFSEF